MWWSDAGDVVCSCWILSVHSDHANLWGNSLLIDYASEFHSNVAGAEICPISYDVMEGGPFLFRDWKSNGVEVGIEPLKTKAQKRMSSLK